MEGSPATPDTAPNLERAAFWASASAFGALWGTVEITLGSFLHTVKIPFAGAMLASLGAAILVAQRQIYPARGTSLATAAVAALVKSISPGGIVVGPMIGIATEGLLVELALLAAPRAFAGALAAGALCAMWAASQKLLSQFFFFGGTLLDLYVAALKKAGDWMGVRGGGWLLLGAFVAVLAALGALFGGLGRRVGADARRRLERRA